MQVVRTSSIVYYVSLAVVLGGGVGLIGHLSGGPGLWLGLGVFVGILGWGLRKPLRRWRRVRQPFPEEWRRWLRRRVPFYGALDEEGKTHFERDMTFVLTEHAFEGVDGVKLTDELRLSVAAGVALMLYGRPDWELSGGRTFLFYPNRFDDEYYHSSAADYDGMAHQQGPVIFTASAVARSWRYPLDGNNVILHELAHLFDFMNTDADGVPALIDPGSSEAWQELMRREMERVRNRDSVLDDYAATAPSEFFAVSVESFFEQPLQMKNQHPELFDAMCSLFNLDPRLPWQRDELDQVAPGDDHSGAKSSVT